jgi:hypothetical protein
VVAGKKQVGRGTFVKVRALEATLHTEMPGGVWRERYVNAAENGEGAEDYLVIMKPKRCDQCGSYMGKFDRYDGGKI